MIVVKFYYDKKKKVWVYYVDPPFKIKMPKKFSK